MTDCDELRRKITHAKHERNQALRDNAVDENAGIPPRHSDADIKSLRLAVDMAVLEALEHNDLDALRPKSAAAWFASTVSCRMIARC